jgi:hypothetical protein
MRSDAPADVWISATFDIATSLGAMPVTGYVLGGIGLHYQQRIDFMSEDGTDQFWQLTHINTGHAICVMRGRTELEARVIGRKFTDLTDWSFEGLSGWQNRDPALRDKIATLVEQVQVVVAVTRHDDAQAKKILEQRERRE